LNICFFSLPLFAQVPLLLRSIR